MTMQISARAFDRELTLGELLGGVGGSRLDAALATLLGADFRLVSRGGEQVAGAATAPDPAVRLAITYDLEPLGWLEVAADTPAARAAASLLELLCRQGARYHMASELHIEVVQANYEALQKQYAALQESEERYRLLSQQLEVRVQEQVGLIETTQRQLYQAEKMAAVGQLAAGVAHEINNPIGFVQSNLGTARRYLQKLGALAPALGQHAELGALWKQHDMDFVLEDFDALLSESLDGTARVARIVADLKGFSSIDQSADEAVDINDCVRAVCNVSHTLISPHAEVVLELGDVPRVHCDARRLNEVFLNLALNAAQAMDTRGELRICTRSSENTVQVEFADNGRGIAPELMSRIFDPFFTTREVGQGAGLGLTVSRDVVLAYHGRIDVQSAPGSGSRFTVVLPLGAPPDTHASHPAASL